jgi:hypothetical protein
MRRFGVILSLGALSLAGLLALAAPSASASQTVVTPNGTWYAYPGAATVNQTTVQQPINADGTSNFKANGKAVIPVKFSLATGTGPFLFESVFSDNPAVTSDDYSFLDWQSGTPLTFANLTNLSAVYAFTQGTCQAGSLRWTVTLNDNGTDRNLDIQYQPGENGVGDQFCAPGTSGANLIGSTDTIYVTQQFNGGHTFPSSYNNTYADAVAQLGSLPVSDIALIVDSGWAAGGDEVVTLSSATVGTSSYSDTFVPPAATATTATCPTQQATIKITKTSGTPSGAVNEPITIQPNDNDGFFRIVDCKYMYNLATSSLSGVGRYEIEVVINGTPATGAAYFDLR